VKLITEEAAIQTFSGPQRTGLREPRLQLFARGEFGYASTSVKGAEPRELAKREK